MIHTLSAIELHQRFCSGELSAIDIVNTFLERIDQFDGEVGAFLCVFQERVRERAKALDEKRSRGEKVGRLAGVPIALKDNMHLKGEISTCGSKFLTNYKAPFDSTVAKLLEEEDALIIGKTNLDEFAMGSSTENSALQKTCNPWDLSRVPGGSSGGSAAAVAARLCPVALGSDTGGSIRQPGSLCGVVGFKPTYGRVSRFGLVAFGSSLDQIGPFATSCADAARVMEVIGAPCDRDSTSLPIPREDYLDGFSESLEGLKIGVPHAFLEGLDEQMKGAFDTSIKTLEKLGAKIESIDLSILKYSIPVYYILATAEASTNLARFDGVRYGKRSEKAETLAEVYDFSKEEGFGPEVKRRILMGTYVLSAGYQDAFYKKAQRVRTLMLKTFQKIFETCDLIAMPTCPSPAFKKGAIQDPIKMYLEDIYTIAANLVGSPAISVPSAINDEGLPIGLQIVGPQKADQKVLAAANAFEKATNLEPKIPGAYNATR